MPRSRSGRTEEEKKVHRRNRNKDSAKRSRERKAAQQASIQLQVKGTREISTAKNLVLVSVVNAVTKLLQDAPNGANNPECVALLLRLKNLIPTDKERQLLYVPQM